MFLHSYLIISETEDMRPFKLSAVPTAKRTRGRGKLVKLGFNAKEAFVQIGKWY